MKIYAVKILDISQELLDNIYLFIDLERKFKIDKLINKKDKIRTLIGEILIRTIIIEELNISNKYIKFEKNRYGKPYLKEYPQFNFNISHSEDFVVCGIDDKNIGIDIEAVKYIEYQEIAKSFFSKNEFDYIIKNNPDIQLNKFYEIWTLKESYIKCCGQGLSIPLSSFSIDIGQDANIELIDDNKYKFKKFEIELGYKMALCSLNNEIPNNVLRIDQNNLINKYLRFNSYFV